jgi:dTDP-glucose pyrophosphorylase
VDNPQEYGVFVKRGDFLEEIIEKPKEFKGNLINTGLYKFTPEIFQKISEVELSPRGEYELTDAINLLAQEKKVKVKELKDYWLDFGKPEDIKKVSDFLEKEKKTP